MAYEYRDRKYHAMNTSEIFESLVEQGMALPFDDQANYINQTFTGKLFKSLQTDDFDRATFSITRTVQLIGPHLDACSSHKRQTFIEVVATFDLEKADFETIFSNLPSFKVIDGSLIASAYFQHGLDFALAMTKLARPRNVIFTDLYESLIAIDETDRDRIFLEFPDSIRLPHRTTSLSLDEIKKGIHKTETELSIKNEIVKTIDSGKPFSQLLKEIEDGLYMPYVKRSFLIRIILSVSTNQPENVVLLNDFSNRLEISSSQLRWMRLVNECTMADDVPASTWEKLFKLLYGRDQHDLQNWFETLRSTYPLSYWKLFEFEGIGREEKSLLLFRALVQHLCYTKDSFEFPTNHALITKLFTNYLSFVQENKFTHSFSLLIKLVSCFAQFGDNERVKQIGGLFALRNSKVEPLSSHNEYLIELGISHCKSKELDFAFDIYKGIDITSVGSFSYLEFLLCDLARYSRASDISLFVFKRHISEKTCFEQPTLTTIFRSSGFFDTYRYQSRSIYKELLDIGQNFDERTLHALVEAVRFTCDLNELEHLVNEISISQTSTPSEVYGELMFSYLDHNQSDDALKVLHKIASIDGFTKAEAKYGSLLATYDIPIINEVILQWGMN